MDLNIRELNANSKNELCYNNKRLFIIYANISWVNNITKFSISKHISNSTVISKSDWFSYHQVRMQWWNVYHQARVNLRGVFALVRTNPRVKEMNNMNLVVDIRLHISKREENVPENILLHTRFNPFTMDVYQTYVLEFIIQSGH